MIIPHSIDRSKAPPIALFWGCTESDTDGLKARSLIRGSHLDRKLTQQGERVRDDIERYFKEIVEPILKHRFPSGGVTVEKYRDAYAYVSSRAFVVDAWIGMGMVPIADAFNHGEENEVCLCAEYEVCRECGALEACEHDSDGEASNSDRNQWERTRKVDTVDMVSQSWIQTGNEIFNTYNESRRLKNWELMMQYGFLIEGNAADEERERVGAGELEDGDIGLGWVDVGDIGAQLDALENQTTQADGSESGSGTRSRERERERMALRYILGEKLILDSFI
ncbi:hypothetical protein SISSUDRAFT_1131527 [Sistotremastrum suecicum HHB10207 ss-3]|uniref:SET domain-containing protein n=1 Tax=Sistotremastrum suecicum HHB10207 ss-3 TaxID=1314776 RepID=A0A166A2L2_9AGAM|nr:hypothetical protein SISSUDRAFT_1131527 [Sistotremastrum suecicum HHB10207 ss-3]